eukprot:TRINITY_DN1211_c0_g1_i28.p1 TRINITY_DN1211_c0_g1~~TRINITY_DN1211_c0_g1_i28.p1  ORF type:complete len:200 (-),score=26.06 TRINITY_DN1211_c0_g1_i28:174-731(-)
MHHQNSFPAVFIFIGVCGSGKTTTGQALANRLNRPFFDADTFHPLSNIEKMSRGESLNDHDRIPWLQAIREAVTQQLDRGTGFYALQFFLISSGAVFSCSALRKQYRKVLLGLDCYPTIVFVWLRGSRQEIYNRMLSRQHFMPISLLDSQLAILEEPDDDERIIICDVDKYSVDEIVEQVLCRFS